MSIKTLCSEIGNLSEAIKDMEKQAVDFSPKMVVFFASSKYEPYDLSRQMQNLFPQSQIFGCSTAGEIVTGKILKNSIVAMLFEDEDIEDVKVEVLENIKNEDKVSQAFKNFEDYYKIPMMEMDYNKYLGIILIDGLSSSEEKVMERIGDLTNVQFIGASAGDDLQFKETYVYFNGKTYSNAAVLALIRPKKNFEILKTQSFKNLDKKLVATKVDEGNRVVYEFNGRPAVDAYSEMVGTTPENASDFFMSNPVGLLSGDEPFVRSPQQVQGQAIKFYCNIKEGMELSLLESTDIVIDTNNSVKTRCENSTVSGMINFHCILRTLELEQKNQTKQYGNIFSDFTTIGFSTYGEEYIGHINQTSTILIFKE
ncbi:MAG: FIST N-terminal domain-containing protein [Chitinispirillia bacterium]|jgi:hypothetical protein